MLQIVADEQVKKLMKLVQTGRTFGIAAAKAGTDEKTTRKYKKLGEAIWRGIMENQSGLS